MVSSATALPYLRYLAPCVLLAAFLASSQALPHLDVTSVRLCFDLTLILTLTLTLTPTLIISIHLPTSP